jgi:prepilin-type processing-associated H-X9-DG protein
MWPRHLSEANLQQFEQTYRYQPPQASNANVAATAILFELTATHAGDPYVGFADGHLERSKLPPHQAAPLTPTTQ